MKPLHASLLAMAGLMALFNSPLVAQDTAAVPQPESSAKLNPSPEPKRDVPSDEDRGRNGRASEEKSVPFIGVLTGEVPRELRAHFTLPEGFGLLVEEVMPDTPAKAAGLKEDDILIAFEDQKLVNMDQLQTLVRSKKKDDQVTLTIITAGQEAKVTVKIDERMMPVRSGRGGDRSFQPFEFFGGDRSRGIDQMREMQERMREYQERSRDGNRNGNLGSSPSSQGWKGSGRRDGGDRRDRDESSSRNGGDRNHHNSRNGDQHGENRRPRETANVTRSDDSGIYSLREDGDRMIFNAKPKDGQEQSWNLNNETERKAIPAPMQEKLRLLEEIRGESPMKNPESSEAKPSPAPEGSKPAGDI